MPNTWYYLDPDNNKDDPPQHHCARCKRLLKNASKGDSFIGIIFHPLNPWYRVAKPLERSNGFIGEDCHKKMISEYGIMQDKTQDEG